jgi:outer membrane autotransporter protein
VLLALNGLQVSHHYNRYWNEAGDAVIEQGDGIGEAAPDGSVFIDGRGMWGRIEGFHSRSDLAVSTTSADFDIDAYKIEAGVDGQFYESDAGQLIGGITVHYGHASTAVSSVYGDGDIDTDGYGFGGTLIWYGENGVYVDGRASATWYDSDLNSSLTRRSLADGITGFGYALSLEAGKRIKLDPNWALTPQVQLNYGSVDIDSFTDAFDTNVSPDRVDSLRGRFGLSVDYENSWYAENGLISRAHAYGIANLYYEALGEGSVAVAGTKFTSRMDRLWGGVGFGGTYNWNQDKFSLYGEGTANTSLADFGDSYVLKGTVGFKIKW